MSEQHITQRRHRVELHCVGEVLTSDKVFERIEQADKEMATKRKAKRRQVQRTPQQAHRAQAKELLHLPARTMNQMMSYVRIVSRCTPKTRPNPGLEVTLVMLDGTNGVLDSSQCCQRRKSGSANTALHIS